MLDAPPDPNLQRDSSFAPPLSIRASPPGSNVERRDANHAPLSLDHPPLSLDHPPLSLDPQPLSLDPQPLSSNHQPTELFAQPRFSRDHPDFTSVRRALGV